ncbi:MAG: YitT family protein, partial [Clostridia bacterium]|nr:YitT family protein [Clostridia bacterium]
MQKSLSPARLAQLALGAAILAFGLFNIHSRCRITEGGVLGMTLLIQHWTGLSPAVSEVALDVTCYLLGLRYLGRSFLPRALAATGSYALAYAL